jgi:phosphoribosylaminoimidazole (AIR) synthetase
MFQVFNMGIGMAVVVAAKNAAKAISLLKAKPIGQIERGRGRTRLVF